MSLPLPYQVKDTATQGNFDKVAKQFPLSRKSMAIEAAHLVGGAGEPGFLNSWANAGGGFQVVRFWKDPMGLVHVEGMVTGGTIGIGVPVFNLPAGYRPGTNGAVTFPANSNGAYGRVTARVNGDITADVGSNVDFSFNFSFRQGA